MDSNSQAFQDAMRDMLDDDDMVDEEDVMVYDIPDEMLDRIENNFTYHAPNGDSAKRYEEIREAGRQFALLIAGYTPISREQSLALTHLEECVMWANASIARNEK